MTEIWGAKQDTGIQNLFDALTAELKPCKTYEDMKNKLEELGWDYGGGIPKLAEDTPQRAVKRAIAGLAIIRLQEKRHMV